MKRSAIPVALLAATVAAQDTTTISFSVCPTASTTTITASTTITYCPGGQCNVTPAPTITKPPVWDDAKFTSTLLNWYFTGIDGKITEINEVITVYPGPCRNGPGMCGSTYTITEACETKCAPRKPGWIPDDFTTTVYKCDRCGPKHGPTTITEIIPCETGAYAKVTPKVGPWHGDEWSDNGKPVAPVAGEEWADNGKGKPVAPVAGEEWADNGKPVAPVAGETWADSGKPVAPATGGDSGKTPVADYKGAASKTVAASSLFAVAIGALAFAL